ncbi:MAG: flagellar biosynthetic protein FliO [Pseudomonadota bacterium]
MSKPTQIIAVYIALCSIRSAWAQTAADTPSAPPLPHLMDTAYVFQVLGSLMLVFACLFAVVYAMRRFNRIGLGQSGGLRVLFSVNVGQRERIVLLEAGDEQLLLGIAPGNIRTLHVLEKPLPLQNALAATEGEPRSSSFDTVLQTAGLGGKL